VHGVLIVDKPVGPTSHDVVDRVRRVLNVKRVGHTGTLDPLASGVLPLCLGKATRFARFFTGHDKSYEATVRFGFATTTDDAEGEPLGPPQAVSVDRDALAAAAQTLAGEILQVPPAFSAKQTAGRRHYDIARSGQTVERTACRVTVSSLHVIGVEGDRAHLEVACSAGTYVRALARDLGEALGVGAHLAALRRTRSGPFVAAQALPLAEVDLERAVQRLVPLDGLLLEMPAIRVGEEGLRALRHGRSVGRDLVVDGFPDGVPPERVRVLGPDQALVALAVPRGFGRNVPELPVQAVFQPDLVLIE
jgi:tRNA pseudouridine55 synthase